jgi:formyltetrahydrofolate-dependent phosphoribosylglycinamide formyltransferase
MLKGLQRKWKVSGIQFLLILSTFALGGSLCGYLGRLLMQVIGVQNSLAYGSLYILLVTILWPFCVLLISIPLGQFRFFSNYLRKMGARFGLAKAPVADAESYSPIHTDNKIHVAIFASGTGSNARNLMEYFAGHSNIKIELLVSNKPGSGALHHAANYGVSTLLIEKERFYNHDAYLPELQAAGIDFIILAGFLWKVPAVLVKAFPQRIINLHPSLLPKYGGKGMYGEKVHAAVIAAGDDSSGITIHYVNEHYDEGAIIFQAMCAVEPDDTPQTLAQRIHQLEHKHLPVVAESLITEMGQK